MNHSLKSVLPTMTNDRLEILEMELGEQASCFDEGSPWTPAEEVINIQWYEVLEELERRGIPPFGTQPTLDDPIDIILDEEHRRCVVCEREAIGLFNEGEFLIPMCRRCADGEDPRDPIDIILAEKLPEPEEFGEALQRMLAEGGV